MKTTTLKCSQCGSPLILVSTITEKMAGSRFPQTNSVYRCSNQECQEEKDRQTAKRLKLRDEKALSDQKRAEEKIAKKSKPIVIKAAN